MAVGSIVLRRTRFEWSVLTLLLSTTLIARDGPEMNHHFVSRLVKPVVERGEQAGAPSLVPWGASFTVGRLGLLGGWVDGEFVLRLSLCFSFR